MDLNTLSTIERAGVPLGILDRPRTVWVAPSGNGKYHLSRDCGRFRGTNTRCRTLRQALVNACTLCANNNSLTPEERTWYFAADEYASWTRALERAEAGTHVAFRRSADVPAEVAAWATLVTRSWWLRHTPHNAAIGELQDWARHTLAPRMQACADRLAATHHIGDHSWAIRAATAQKMGHPGRISTVAWNAHDFLALTGNQSRPGHVGSGGHLGQGGVIDTIFAQACTTWIATGDPDLTRLAATEAGREVLEGLDSYELPAQVDWDVPVPEGRFATLAEAATAAWRTQAAEQNASFAAHVVTELTALTEGAAAEAGEYELVSIAIDGAGDAVTQWSDVLAAVYLAQPSLQRDGVAIAAMPALIHHQIRYTLRTLRLDAEFGAVPVDEDPEIWGAAHDLHTRRTVADAPEALRVARAAHA